MHNLLVHAAFSGSKHDKRSGRSEKSTFSIALLRHYVTRYQANHATWGPIKRITRALQLGGVQEVLIREPFASTEMSAVPAPARLNNALRACQHWLFSDFSDTPSAR